MAFCNSCGATLEAGARFCPKCGASRTHGRRDPGDRSFRPAASPQGSERAQGHLDRRSRHHRARHSGNRDAGVRSPAHCSQQPHTRTKTATFAWKLPSARFRAQIIPMKPPAISASTRIPVRASCKGNTATIGGMHTVTAQFESDDSVDKVTAFYSSKLPNANSQHEGSESLHHCLHG